MTQKYSGSTQTIETRILKNKLQQFIEKNEKQGEE